MANGIGGRTVEELNENMSVDEFIRWKKYYDSNPFGQEDLQFARIVKAIEQSNSSKKQRIDIKKYMLRKPQRRNLTAEQQMELLAPLVTPQSTQSS